MVGADSDRIVVISDQERLDLAGALGGFVYNFFRKQEPTETVASNRRAAEKTAQVIGRAVAAITYPGKLDTDYLMMSKRLEVQLAETTLGTLDIAIKDRIKPV